MDRTRYQWTDCAASECSSKGQGLRTSQATASNNGVELQRMSSHCICGRRCLRRYSSLVGGKPTGSGLYGFAHLRAVTLLSRTVLHNFELCSSARVLCHLAEACRNSPLQTTARRDKCTSLVGTQATGPHGGLSDSILWMCLFP